MDLGAVIARLDREALFSSTEASIKEGETVLYTLAVVLLILWLLGMVSGYTVGAFIHVLLVIAIVLFLVQIIGGRRPAL